MNWYKYTVTSIYLNLKYQIERKKDEKQKIYLYYIKIIQKKCVFYLFIKRKVAEIEKSMIAEVSHLRK